MGSSYGVACAGGSAGWGDVSKDDTITLMMALKDEAKIKKEDGAIIDRIKVSKTVSDRGSVINRNSSLKEAQGRWIAFLNVGDVGSVGIAFIILFAIGRLIFRTGDATYLVLLEIYGADGLLTISHRIMLHENLGQAHRKHAYQIMANELKIGHVKVSLLYMVLQLTVSLGFIYLCPNTILAHWCYLVGTSLILIVAYTIFMIKYYPLHEAYLKSLKNGNSVNK